jgi:hypothetical protein
MNGIVRYGRTAAILITFAALAACSSGSGGDDAANNNFSGFDSKGSPTLLVPGDNAQGVSRNAKLEWSAVEGADAYQVVLGSSAGASDLLDSGTIAATSFQAERLPPQQQIFVRIGALVGGSWSYGQTSFVTQNTSVLMGVPPTSDSIDVSQPLRWEPIAGAQAYYLYVGSTPGTKDLVDSGETGASSYPIVNLHGGSRVYARLHTRVADQWLFEDYVFDVPAVARLLQPQSSTAEVDTEGLLAKWSTVDDAVYRVTIGTQDGLADLWDSGEIEGTGVPLPSLRTGFTWHVRVGTLFQGEWRYSDAQVFTMPMPQLLKPVNGATDMDVDYGFEWSPVADPIEYSLRVGTKLGATNLANVQSTSATRVQVPNLPSGVPLFVRVGARTALGWRYREHVVQVGGALANPTIVYPSTGTVDANVPFEWVHDPLVQSYQLQIGSEPGLADVHASGLIHVSRRFVPGLPQGSQLYGRVTATYVDGVTRATDFPFVVAHSQIDALAYFAEAKHATERARLSAGIDNVPQANTVLAQVRRNEQKSAVNCVSYSNSLREQLVQSNVALESRQVSVCLNPNTFDCHALVEVRDPQTDVKVLLDPTFGLSPRDPVSGEPLSIEGMSAAVRAQAWSSIDYEYLTAQGDLYGKSYYMDYPLLFVNVYTPSLGGFLQPLPASILNYYESVGASVVDDLQVYVVQCPAQTT